MKNPYSGDVAFEPSVLDLIKTQKKEGYSDEEIETQLWELFGTPGEKAEIYQTLKVTRIEATVLVMLITKALIDLEKNYQDNKEEDGFLKNEALSEIALVKGLSDKVGLLYVAF